MVGKVLVPLLHQMGAMGSENKTFHEVGWLKLDNAAKLFPAIMTNELPAVFRITAFLKDPVRISALTKAVAITSERFPYFSVSLGSGFFWHFLEYRPGLPRIQLEEDRTCTAFAVSRRDEPLYRIVIKKNRLSVEFFHILTDGGGAVEYLKSLLFTYFKLTGKQILSSCGILTPESPVMEEEMEDGYNRFFSKSLPAPTRLTRAWHIPFSLNNKPRLRVLYSEIPLDKILEVSRSLKVTLTEYLTSVLLFTLYNIYLKEKLKGRKHNGKAIRVEVPVNLRKIHASRTMRNFSLFLLPDIDLRLGEYTFEEILKSVHHAMQSGAESKQISRQLTRNVRHEKRMIIRALPLFIKKMAISAVYKNLGSKQCTSIISNIGVIKLPEEMEEYIDAFAMVPTPPNTSVKLSCGVTSFNNKIRIVFCNITDSREAERLFFKFLIDSGIPVKILKID
jgi:NRPS condensation-like uncharacterized protein